ncbi:MAG: Xaa-Pro peptidase family protein [Planctomycetes bacterium]|nr:Xaa-Pro peptidase family protein [Planctomycetota bacterium]
MADPRLPARRELFVAGALGAAALGCRAAQASRERPAPSARDGSASSDRAAELDRLFADLTNQAHTVQPIRADERAARRARAAQILAEHSVDALLVEGGATFAYLAGISWWPSERLFALVVLADGTHFWVSPAFEAEKALTKLRKDSLLGEDVVTWDEHEYPWRPLAAELARRRVARIAIDPAARFFVADGVANAFGRERTMIADRIVLALRGRKDAHELELLRRASELTQASLVAVAEHVRPGMLAAEISELVRHAHQKIGLTSPWDLTLVGAQAAFPHGEDKSARLEKDQFVLIDTGGTLHGYQSDTTRTWCPAGRPPETEARAWTTVRDAQQRAFEGIRPGVRCSEIDRLARAAIERAGFGAGYAALTHRLGHGIGMEGHEAPYFDGGSDVVLAPGMTLSNEPGIYVLGRYGVRLEDIVVATESGADHFGAWQSGPLSPA